MSTRYTQKRREAVAAELGLELAAPGLFCQVPRGATRGHAPCGNAAVYIENGSPICAHHVARRRAHYAALGSLARKL